MNKHEIKIANNISLPKRGDTLVNVFGYPKTFQLPTLENISGKYINTMYSTNDITVERLNLIFILTHYLLVMIRVKSKI